MRLVASLPAAWLLANLTRAASEGLSWEDWDRRQVCHPLDYETPSTETELADIVARANEAGEPLKVVGGGHSFSAIALTNGHMVSLDKMNKILHVNGTLVKVQGGMRLHDLNAELERHNLSLPNLGATCQQSIAGATATGTHGTGRLLGNMATQIASLRLVLANGTAIEASSSENPDIFQAARIGLGCLGVISELTLQTVPLFKLKLTNRKLALEDLLTKLDDEMVKHERLQWYWSPPDEQNATLVLRDVVTDADGHQPCWTDDKAGLFGEPAKAFGEGPVKYISETSCVDVSYKALCGSQEHYEARLLYTEMEMFVPAEKVKDAINEFRNFQKEVLPVHKPSVQLFTGVRYVAKDDMWLSQAHGRDTAVISIIVYGPSKEEAGDPTEFARYAQELERLTEQKYDGRPHWGKMNWATEETLKPSYNTTWKKFLDLRARLDPNGIFLNDYLNARFGLGIAPAIV